MMVVLQPELGCLVVTGPDRASWLNGIVTADVGKLASGQGAWSLLLTKQGKIQTDLVIVEAGEKLWLSVAPGTAASVVDFLDRLLVMEDAELNDASAEKAWLSVHGEGAEALARAIAEQVGGFSGSVSWTEKPGAAAVVPRESLSQVEQLLKQRSDAILADETSWQRFRVEHSLPVFGVDYSSHDNPHQASLERRTVDWSKGCYLGQEVVCMQDMRGKVKRRLCRLTVEGAAPKAGASVNAGDTSVGTVTSAAEAPTPGRSVVLASVAAPYFEPGTELSIDSQPALVS